MPKKAWLMLVLLLVAGCGDESNEAYVPSAFWHGVDMKALHGKLSTRFMEIAKQQYQTGGRRARELLIEGTVEPGSERELLDWTAAEIERIIRDGGAESSGSSPILTEEAQRYLSVPYRKGAARGAFEIVLAHLGGRDNEVRLTVSVVEPRPAQR